MTPCSSQSEVGFGAQEGVKGIYPNLPDVHCCKRKQNDQMKSAGLLAADWLQVQDTRCIDVQRLCIRVLASLVSAYSPNDSRLKASAGYLAAQ